MWQAFNGCILYTEVFLTENKYLIFISIEKIWIKLESREQATYLLNKIVSLSHDQQFEND